ncbi:hypothetical protein [Caenimonas aquaedulcis]|uniref:Uncharacterized protein n=1 Tax=Caenimonas aquaedulcis TaxID=2793270 RepID=A0A931MIY5_9BURK|nr:hypothetical protein [Caenimonas aquaedulcis]MBG9390631.1 hypothetical protein [Caenimonas aquaedulcis]
MQTTTAASAIPLPDVDLDGPARVIPTASVAPLDGPPDGERINLFVVKPVTADNVLEGLAGDLREGVLRKPLTCVGLAFAIGYLFGRR